MRTIVPWFAAILGLGAIANGIYMLVAPANWYFAVPGVTNTGPFNQHFIRDIGLTYGFVGGALVVGAGAPAMRVILWAIASAWLSAHALFHFWEVAVGICGPSQLIIDLPAVFTPALITGALVGWAVANHTRRASAAPGFDPAG